MEERIKMKRKLTLYMGLLRLGGLNLGVHLQILLDYRSRDTYVCGCTGCTSGLGFPKFRRGLSCGLLIMRYIIHSGLYWGPMFGNHIMNNNTSNINDNSDTNMDSLKPSGPGLLNSCQRPR